MLAQSIKSARLVSRISTPSFQRSLSTSTACFGISLKSRFKLPRPIQQPAGGIVGTVNDATPIPEVDRSHGSYHWSYEKMITLAMLPLAITPFATGALHPILDALMGTLLVAHAHIGFQSCIIDYIPKRVFGKFHSFCIYLLTAGSATAVWGVYELETTDVGLVETISRVWHA
ncbi:hypothetical protein NADFUDRAFT_83935 [Nadsonia fulvescens var. elongata DSM 6958]|uniref:Succinate dehydrogenase [ubiquinone] cytochrome b small subunit n=1 Tax=Nadsonia fulvescens var. elongata DSM 6958 TaxID=857566 RepID=A0A1E3PET9_9ASCO|nr:hypothetical protein NADFUDRAFT_83935 [Nadsonia fulvescens var. elongata DSM 6958]